MSSISSIDIALLQLLKYRKEYDRLHRVVNARTIEERTRIILKDFGLYFAKVEECDRIPVTGDFFTFFSAVQHRSLSQDDLKVYRSIFEQAEQDIPPGAQDLLVSKLGEASLALRLGEVLIAYNADEEIDVPTATRQLLDAWEEQGLRTQETPEVTADEELFDDDVNNVGLKWRWDCLNAHMRPLRGGDFGIIAARPDKGKTTALADNVTYMAAQLDDVYEGQQRNILWFNNEGPGKRILKRCVQSALEASTPQLVQLQQAGKLWAAYEKALGISKDRLKVFDVHRFESWQIEQLIRRLNPGLVILDMIDNISFGSATINGGNRQDSIIEGMYQWARSLGVTYDCPILATSQVSFDGENEAYPGLGMLKDSKTGKQGAADFIITIGTTSAIENTRFIGMTKNKLMLAGVPMFPRAELILDSAVGRYQQ